LRLLREYYPQEVFFVDKEQKKPSRRLFILGKRKNLMERRHNQ